MLRRQKHAALSESTTPFACTLAKASARHCTGVKIPKIGKRVFRGPKTPISHRLRKGALSRKIPIFLVEPCTEMGIVRLKAPFSEAMGNGSFWTPKPSFPDFGDFDPCAVPTLSQFLSSISGKEKHITGLSRDWVGAKILFMCFFGSSLMGEKNT